ncbi:MAG: ParB/RepB/Spo0J family partition protein [Thermaerobacter sp.]|nr:ParB/RepB/Spo0J family partition protein [Thermaerobacter sp.]
MAKRGLGRGLEALIPEVRVTPGEGLQQIAVSAIRPNPYQPRREFEPEALRELAESISQHGVLQPLVVRSAEQGYELIAGERRWRAAQIAGLEHVPVVLRSCDDGRLLEIALVENLQREDLNPLEEAEALSQLSEQRGMRQDEIAAVVGKSRSAVANSLRLLGLPREVKELVRHASLSAGHARAILGLPPSMQVQAAQQAVAKDLSVREVETLARGVGKARPTPAGGNRFSRWEERIGGALELPVRIRAGSRGGALEIRFRSEEELALLFGRLVPEED